MRIEVFTAPKEDPEENTGIGDTLIAIPAILGLHERYPEAEISFHIKDWQVPWARLFWAKSEIAEPKLINEEADLVLRTSSTGFWTTDDQLAQSRGINRLDLICERFGVKAKFPESIQADADDFSRPIRIPDSSSSSLVVIAPFSMGASRVWPIYHYCWLAEQLIAKGHKVAFLGKTGLSGPGEDIAITTGIQLLGDLPPLQVAMLMSKASLFIGNDSGMAHLAGLLKTKAIAMCGMSIGKIIFGGYKSVYPLQSAYFCSGCMQQPDHGFRPVCRLGCRAMFEISPETVLEKALQLLTI